MSTFLGYDRPVITGMISGADHKTEAGIFKAIEYGHEHGVDAFGLQLECMPRELRTEALFKKIFRAMGDKPAYVTNYRRGNDPALTDEQLGEELLLTLECGGKLIDVRGDMYLPSPKEITTDPAAVQKQMEFINEVHRRGGEVLMSSHVFQYIPPEEVLQIAQLQASRGADIAKIVNDANTEAEMQANFHATFLLKNYLTIPSLFLCNGACNRLHRFFGPALGSALFLTVCAPAAPGVGQPPLHKTLELMKAIIRDDK